MKIMLFIRNNVGDQKMLVAFEFGFSFGLRHPAGFLELGLLLPRCIVYNGYWLHNK